MQKDKQLRRKKLISIDVCIGDKRDFIDKIFYLASHKVSSYICVANVHMLVEAYRDKEFANVVNSADIITPDGMPLVWALRLLYGIKQERIAGPDLMPEILKMAENKGRSVFLYGSTQKVLNQIVSRIKREFPNLKISGYISPPFRRLTKKEQEDIISKINNARADIILVSLGCPKQEKWMAQMRGRIASVMIGVGAAFPIYARELKRAPVWMQKIGLEWFYRFMQEPSRLFKRYAVTNSVFLYLLIKTYLEKLINKKA